MPKPLTEADFHGPYTHERTGLQYEDPLKNTRNIVIRLGLDDIVVEATAPSANATP